MRPAKPLPPPTLSKRAAAVWEKYMHDFAIDDTHGLFVLEQALRAYDAMEAALADVEKRGPTYADRYGAIKSNPSVLHARDARAAMLSALKQLRFDQDPPGRQHPAFHLGDEEG